MDYGTVEGVGGWVEGDGEGGPDAVVETAVGGLGFDPCFGKERKHVRAERGGAGVRVLGFVVACGESVEALFCQSLFFLVIIWKGRDTLIYQIRLLGRVHFYDIWPWLALPVG